MSKIDPCGYSVCVRSHPRPLEPVNNSTETRNQKSRHCTPTNFIKGGDSLQLSLLTQFRKSYDGVYTSHDLVTLPRLTQGDVKSPTSGWWSSRLTRI